MPSISLLNEYREEVEKDIEKINKEVVSFHLALVKQSPVDTGHFRKAWELTRKGRFTWTIRNSMEYASILWAGRRQGVSTLGNPKMYGSEQWPDGGEPMLAKFKYELERL